MEPLVTACAQDGRSIFLEDACSAHIRFPTDPDGNGCTGERVQEYERDKLISLPYLCYFVFIYQLNKPKQL